MTWTRAPSRRSAIPRAAVLAALGWVALAVSSAWAGKRSELTPDWYKSFNNYRKLAGEWLTPDIEGGRSQPDSISAKACESLAGLTCTAGTYDDGTGSASTLTFEASRARYQAEEIRERAQLAGTDSAWDDLLSGSNPRLFRLMKDLFRLGGGDGCSGSLEKLTALCRQSMAPKLSELTWKMIDAHNAAYFGKKVDAPLASPVGGDAVYTEFSALIQEPGFQSAQARYVSALTQYVIPDQKALLDHVEKTVFPEVRRLIVERMQESVKNPDMALYLRQRLESIKFDRNLNCAELDPFAGVLDPGAKFFGKTHTVQLCGKMLWMNRSEFGIVFNLAHEMAHAIDPCNVSQPMYGDWKKTDVTRIPNLGKTWTDAEKSYVLGPKLLQCLQEPTSVEARKPIRKAVNVDPMGRGRALFCGEIAAEDAFGTRDQLIEAVPDWIASEVLPLYMQSKHPELVAQPHKMRLGYANALRGLCRSDFKPTPVPGDVHPVLESRIEAMLGTQPLIRTHMNCPPLHPSLKYCPGPVSKNFKNY